MATQQSCHYRYDPLDCLAMRSEDSQASEQLFYQQSRLTTEIKGQARQSLLQTPDYLLAQHAHEAGLDEPVLIASSLSGSVIHGFASWYRQSYAFTPYGIRAPLHDPLRLPGFNRERPDSLTGHYLLGQGYRAFNPVLMRFNSPDRLSPFADGGPNAYAYCAGDPVNGQDPSGQAPQWLSSIWRSIKAMGRERRDPPRPIPHRVPGISVPGGQPVDIAGRSILVDRSPMSRLPIRIGPMTANQQYTLDAVAGLPPYQMPTSLAGRAAAAIPVEQLGRLSADHPVNANRKLHTLVIESQRSRYMQAFSQAGSDQERLVLTTQVLRRYPQVLHGQRRRTT